MIEDPLIYYEKTRAKNGKMGVLLRVASVAKRECYL